MNQTLAHAAFATALVGACGAASAETFGDVARVVSATPIYDRIPVTRRECRVETVTAYEERRLVEPAPAAAPRSGIGPGTVLGAVVGGVLGHQFGNSSGGRDRGTAAGAIVGGLVGHAAERDALATASPGEVVVERAPVTREVERCQPVTETSERLAGYEVRYEYNGREFTTRLPYDPGPQMPVNVEVRPPMPSGPYAGPRAPNYR